MSLRDIFKQCYRNFLKVLPPKLALNIDNLRGYHRLINFKNPKYFGEKIQWLKINGNLEKYTKYADKYEVREYISNEIGEEYLIPLLGVYDNTSSIDFEKLPNQFILKLNTGSGYNIIVKDKSKLNKSDIIKKLDEWLKEDYYKIKKENQYKNIKKKILCEKLISAGNEDLQDYKFYCFDGKIEFIEVDFDRFKDHKMNFYNLDWNLLELKKGKYDNFDGKFLKPKNFKKMIQLVEKLAKNFQFVRVDFYNVNGKIYFGELTFTPAGGLTPFTPLEKDLEYARKIKLENKPKLLFFASISKNSSRLDGETIKNRVMKDFLSKKLSIITIDTHDFRKNKLKIAFKTLCNYHKADIIVISASQTGASKLLKFLNIIHTKKPVYYFLIGGSMAEHIKQKKQKIETFKNINVIYVESNKLKNDLNLLGLSNVVVLPNFRNVLKFDNKYKKSSITKFVFYGRVVKVKGIEYAIDLIKRLTENKFNVMLDIYGQVEENYLNELNKRIDNNKNINYCGSIIPDGKIEYELLSQYDIFILPTEHPGEGLPGALIDAYFAGLAVLVSDWKYAREYVKDNVNGRIFEYKNYDDMYAKAIEMIRENKIEQYKKKSLEMSSSYLIDNLLNDFVENLFGDDKNG